MEIRSPFDLMGLYQGIPLTQQSTFTTSAISRTSSSSTAGGHPGLLVRRHRRAARVARHVLIH
jgi:hypothetical protein